MVDVEESEESKPATSKSRTKRSSDVELTETSDARSTRPSRQPTGGSPEDDDEMDLKYGAEHVIRLFVPVSLCMVAVVLSMKTVDYFSTAAVGNEQLAYTPFNSNEEDDTSTRVLSAIGNAAIMIGFIVVMTFVLILLYKYSCYKILHGWMIFSSFLLLTLIAGMYGYQMVDMHNWCVSLPTFYFVLFNYAAMGMISIHWKGPLLMQQAYLISVSALMALFFIKKLPDWTGYALLVLVSIWDLIAVLCPKGPLNMLVKMSQERDEPIFPALIYSSGILLPYTITMSKLNGAKSGEGEARGEAKTSSSTPSGESEQKRSQSERGRAGGEEGSVSRSLEDEVEEEETGIKLGLGDFIFYSVLIGMAVKHSADWNTVVACYVAILMGLCATLFLLAVFKKALPALPISITAGLIFYFATSFLITPFTNQLVIHQLTY